MELQLIRHYRWPIFLLTCAAAVEIWALSIDITRYGAMGHLMAAMVKYAFIFALAIFVMSIGGFVQQAYAHWRWQNGRGNYCYVCFGIVETGIGKEACLRCGKRQRMS